MTTTTLKNNFNVVRDVQQVKRYFEAVSLFPALTFVPGGCAQPVLAILLNVNHLYVISECVVVC